MPYLISAETRDQLIDLLEDVGRGIGGYPVAGQAVNILPHIKGAPTDADFHAQRTDPPEQADGITAAKAALERNGVIVEVLPDDSPDATDADIARANFAGLPRDVEVDSLGIPWAPDPLRGYDPATDSRRGPNNDGYGYLGDGVSGRTGDPDDG